MGIKIQKIQKNQKNQKPKHIAFLCHIMSIQVDKHGLDIFKLENHVSTPSPNAKLCLMKSNMKRSGFGFQTCMEISKPPKNFILE